MRTISLTLLAMMLMPMIVSAKSVVGKIEFVSEIPLLDLSAKARVLYGGVEKKEPKISLQTRSGAQTGAKHLQRGKARSNRFDNKISNTFLERNPQWNTFYSGISSQDEIPHLQRVKGKSGRAMAKDPYFGFACFAGHNTEQAIFAIEPNGYVMKKLSTDYVPCGVTVDQAHRLAYVSDASNGNVIVYDLVSRKPINSIKMGGCPCGLVLDVPRSRLYVADQSGDRVAIIDTMSLKRIGDVPVGKLPRNLVITPDGRFVYVTNEYGNSVSVVDVQSRRCIKTIPTGQLPLGLAMNPNGKEVYVANSESNYVSVINTQTNTETARIKTTSQPGKLLVDPSTNLVYVATAISTKTDGRGIIVLFDRNTHEIVSRIPTGFGADDLRLDLGKQRLYVQGYDDDSVYVVDLKKRRTAQYFVNHVNDVKPPH
jgi:YVTN family beta-propeller protein